MLLYGRSGNSWIVEPYVAGSLRAPGAMQALNSDLEPHFVNNLILLLSLQIYVNALPETEVICMAKLFFQF